MRLKIISYRNKGKSTTEEELFYSKSFENAENIKVYLTTLSSLLQKLTLSVPTGLQSFLVLIK